MRPDKRIIEDVEESTKTASPDAATRTFRKGRYSNATPESVGVSAAGSDDLEIRVDDVTLVVKEPRVEIAARGWTKYDSRSAVGYGTVSVAEPEERAATVVVHETEDEPLPEWSEWTSEVIDTETRYYRADSRLP